ncbi:MAG: hypothetical protein PHD61_03260, partial [Bacteroidales bacterium]|nr:hypothetical protein [Bacteroidales bacterium]
MKSNTNEAWSRYQGYDNAYAGRSNENTVVGCSIRCLKGGCVSPEADAGEDATICQGTTYTLADATATNYTALVWTTSGTGSFTDSTLLNPIYTPSQADIASGEIELTLTATGQGGCPDAVSTMILTITAAPTANAGVDANICATQTSFTLSGTATGYNALLWTTSGTGTFNDPAILTAVYTLSTADKTAGQVTLTLTATGNAPCDQVNDAMTLTITAAPTTNAGVDANICATQTSFTLSGTATGYNALLWTTSGTGTFNDPA